MEPNSECHFELSKASKLSKDIFYDPPRPPFVLWFHFTADVGMVPRTITCMSGG